MKIDSHGEQWREWLIQNLQRYCFPRSIVNQMIHNGWSLSDATAALDEGLNLLGRESVWRVHLPDPCSAIASFAMDNPRIQTIQSVLTQHECVELIGLALEKKPQLATVVDEVSGSHEHHQGRTNLSVHFVPQENRLVSRLEQRISQLTKWPTTHAEGLQIQFYGQGQQYTAHFDWFSPTSLEGLGRNELAGQRVATTVVYLQRPGRGGATRFPKVGVSLYPQVGDAVFFRNLDVFGQPDELTLHAGEPVKDGVKIVATYWQRERSFNA